ncbi:MAG TPA: endonuclease/exonuclease/phosphatase family protein [Saprospiraceae bacterium]|nr:endonuclease/exonuclease/phosphatase family protein [Saprospiraceae bacterium]
MRSLLFILFSLIYISQVLTQTASFQVMTFNIRYANKGDGVHDWDHRRPLVASIIRFHKVDLFGVQEALRSQLDDLVQDMPEYEWFGVCRTDGKVNPNPDGEFSAILYRKDRFERLEGNTFWLSPTPEIVGSVGWDANLTRIVTWAKFKDKQNGNVFYHFNTHFDHMGVVARAESARLILKKIQEIAGSDPVVLTGDFNCSEKEEPYQVITDPSSAFHLVDAKTISRLPHHGPEASFAGTFQISGLIDHRIDFIFVRQRVVVFRHAILSDNWNGDLASDHLPVLAEIRM